MVQLQKPKYAYYEGEVRPWEGAVLHVGCEAVVRGLNVFEGLKAYWQPDGSMGIVAVPRHFERLQRSAKLLHIPFDMTSEDFDAALHSIIEPLCVPDRDIWVRATLYVVEGHWGENQRSDLVLTAYTQPMEAPAPVTIGVSTWRRASDSVLSARIKTSTNYQATRLAKIEGRPHGHAEMVMLNGADRVAECGGCCLLLARGGRVSTPPATEGALESITVDIAEALADDLGIPFERRPIDRTELYVADEVALAGTLVEITPVTSVDQHECTGKTRLLTVLAERYREAVKGIRPHPAVDLSCRRYDRFAASAGMKAISA